MMLYISIVCILQLKTQCYNQSWVMFAHAAVFLQITQLHAHASVPQQSGSCMLTSGNLILPHHTNTVFDENNPVIQGSE